MYPVEMKLARDVITRDNIPKRYSDEADMSCIIFLMGGNWDYEQLGGHYELYHDHDIFHGLNTYEELKEAEERHHIDPFILSDTEDPASSGNSSDSSSSGNSSEQRRVKKSAAQRHAKFSEEKIKHVEDKLTNDIKEFKH